MTTNNQNGEQIPDKIIDLIRKCLAMTVEHGCTEAEAESHMAKAQELLEKYNLDMSQVSEKHPEQTDLIKAEYPCASSSWERQVFSMVAQNNFCKVIGSGDKIFILGRKVNMFATVEMSNWLIEQIESITEKEMRSYRSTQWSDNGYLLKGEAKRTYRIGFLTGLLDNIRKRLVELRKEREVVNPKITALALNLNTETAHFVSQMFPVLINGRGFGNSGSSGYASGYRAGDKVSVIRPSHHLDNNGILRLT